MGCLSFFGEMNSSFLFYIFAYMQDAFTVFYPFMCYNSYQYKEAIEVRKKKILKNIVISLFALAAACAISPLFQWLGVEEHITTIFVFSVFIVSLCTDGYLYGIVSAVIGTVAINFAFTYPFLKFDFLTPINVISAIIMLMIAIITGMLTTKIKTYEETKTESEREKMRANLLRAVSHDLRTPLTSIYSASSVLHDERENLTEGQKEIMLLNIQEDSEWLIRMVENLLSVTRIDNETMRITKVPTILDELIDSSVTKFCQRHPEQKVEVEVPGEIVVVLVDPILIEQVILNLLENSVCHAKGMTTLSLKVFTLADKVTFEIADDGCGIEEGELKDFFSGCYEGQQDMTRVSRRYAGIGLSVCSTIIKAHGGTITAQNQKSGGALFHFTIQKEKNRDDK